MNVLFYPVFVDNTRLTDHFYRLHWYLFPFKDRITQITLLHTLNDVSVASVPSYLASNLAQITNRFLEVQLVKVRNTLCVKDLAENADFIFLWSTDPNQPDQIPEGDLSPFLKRKKVIRIDHENEQFAGSFYLKFAESFTDDIYESRRHSKEVFKRIVKRCSKSVGYIFGTGPGLSCANQHDFSDGVSIACNSMVRNHALLERLNPPLFVVGDPIFHAGPSSYAAEFRSELISALDKYDADLIVPMRDYHIYCTHLPERFKDRIAALPFKSGKMPNLDLEKSFHVTTTSNILTLFLIPLATTLFNEVRIFGCDGRPAEENTYFWKHDTASQLNEQMTKIQEAHPAFFAIDYDDYYFTHCQTLEKWLAKAEEHGKSFFNMSPTYIPALLSRSIDGIGGLDKDYTIKDTENNEREDEIFVSVFSRGLSFKQFKKKQEITVIMPAFNEEDFIEIAIKSVIDQDFKNLELLVIDDGSTDDTAKIVKRLKNEDSRIKLLENQGKGVSSARNTGIENANGNFICFLDGDDTFDSGVLTARLKVFHKKKKLALVHGSTRFIDEAGRDLDCIIQKNRTIGFEDMSAHPAHLNSVMGRTFFIKKFRFEEGVANGEDWWFLARLLRSGERSAFVVDGSATYRIHKNSTVLKNMDQHEKALSQVIEWLYSPSSEKGVSKKYEKGLQRSCKNDILIHRANNILIWNILCGDKAKASYIISEKLPIDWSTHFTATLLRTLVAIAGIRYFGQPRRQLDEIPHSASQLILDTIESVKLRYLAPKLADAFINVFALDCLTDLHGSKLMTESTDLEKYLSVCYPREIRAHIDETLFIAHLFDNTYKNTCKRVMVDVGAHFGGSAYHFLKREWRVICFEPDSNNRQELVKCLGNDKNVSIDVRAVGEYVDNGKSFYSSEESTGISGMLPFRDSHKQVATVDVTTMTNVVKDNDIDHINFLKIDVGGYDFSVLKGVPWDKIKPDAIECEFEDAKTKYLGHTWRDISDYLEERGYSVYVSEWHPIIRYGIRHDWLGLKRYPCDLADPNAWGNLLAFKDDPGTAALQEALNKVLKVEHPEKIVNSSGSSHSQKATNTVAQPVKKVNQLTNRLSNVDNQKSKPIMKRRLLPRFYSYEHFVEWVQTENLALFRLGQFAMWVLRFLKGHPIASVLGLVILSALVFTPILIPTFASYESSFWTAAALLMLSAISGLGLSFGNKKITEFVEREHYYRQRLRAEIRAQRAEMLRGLKKQEEQLVSRVKAQGQALDLKLHRLAGSAPVFNFSDYQSFNRRLTKDHCDVLLQEWSRKLSLNVTPRSLAYLAHRICTLESAAKGRLASTIEDVVLRVLVATAGKTKNLRVLEIGTLFGIGLAAIYDHASSLFTQVHLTAIDPLDGYYGKDMQDIVTNEIISESTFRGNLARAGVTEDEITLVKAMSTEDIAIEAATKLAHDVLIIDGDHSYAGVKADFVNYLSAVKRGGYIIFDDYNVPEWPDVKEFVDTSVRDNSNVTLVGTSWRTAVFQVVCREIVSGETLAEKPHNTEDVS